MTLRAVLLATASSLLLNALVLAYELSHVGARAEEHGIVAVSVSIGGLLLRVAVVAAALLALRMVARAIS